MNTYRITLAAGVAAALAATAAFFAGCTTERGGAPDVPSDISVLDGVNVRTMHAAYMNFNRGDGKADVIRITTDSVVMTSPLVIEGVDNFEIRGDSPGRGPTKIIAATEGNLFVIKGAPGQRITLRNLVIVPDFNSGVKPEAAIFLDKVAGNSRIEIDSVTVTASTDAKNTPAPPARAFNPDDHRHFESAIATNAANAGATPASLSVRRSHLSHSLSSNMSLASSASLRVSLSECVIAHAGGHGVSVDGASNLVLDVVNSEVSRNATQGVNLRSPRGEVLVRLGEGARLNYNGRCGLQVDGGVATRVAIEGTFGNPVETTGNGHDGIRWVSPRESEPPLLGSVKYWVATHNQQALAFLSDSPVAPTEVGPFSRCLFVGNHVGAVLWNTGGITANFVDCTFANNGEHHHKHQGGSEFNRPNQISFLNCLFAGPETKTASYDTGNRDRVAFRNCALVAAGSDRLAWFPAYHSVAGFNFVVDQCVYGDPQFVSRDVSPTNQDSYAVNNAYFADKGGEGVPLSGWGAFRGGDASGVPRHNPAYSWTRQPRVEPEYLAHLRKGITSPIPFQHHSGSRYGFVHARIIDLYTRLHDWGGHKDFATTALAMFQAMTENWDEENDYLAILPYMDAFERLVKLVPPEAAPAFKERTRKLAIEHFLPKERGDNERAAARAAGLAKTLEIFPALPTVDILREYIDAVWLDWDGLSDTTDNSLERNAVFWYHLFRLADIQDWNTRLNRPVVRSVFHRYRDLVSPAGALPGTSGVTPAIIHSPIWGTVFERAAALFQDSSLRWAAYQMSPPPPLAPPHGAANSALGRAALAEVALLASAGEWLDANLRPVAPTPDTGLGLRRGRNSEMVVDKIVLNRSRQAEKPFAMIEMYAPDSRAFPHFIGSIEYFEFGGAQLLHSAGPSNRSPSNVNNVMIAAAIDGFPHRARSYQPNSWRSSSYPLKRLWPHGDPPRPEIHAEILKVGSQPPLGLDAYMRKIEQLSFVVETVDGGGDGGQTAPFNLLIDNLRLTGPAGTTTLDDFEVEATRSSWRHHTPVVYTDNAFQGVKALLARCGRGANVLSRDFNFEWNIKQYDRLRFDWQIQTPAPPPRLRLNARIVNQGWMLSWPFNVDHPHPEIRKAHVESLGDDSYAWIGLDEYFTPGTKLDRKIVLTREGVMVVFDTLLPDGEADGMEAGPLWQLWAIPQSVGENWFATTGDPALNSQDANMLVYFSREETRSYGMRQVSLPDGGQACTVFARQRLNVMAPVTFISILVPYAADVNPAELAAAISVKHLPQSVKQVELSTREINFRLSLDVNGGEWKVSR